MNKLNQIDKKGSLLRDPKLQPPDVSLIVVTTQLHKFIIKKKTPKKKTNQQTLGVCIKGLNNEPTPCLKK